MQTFWQDLRYGLRILRSRPGFTTVVVLSLALGIGASTAIFTLVNSYLFQKFPVEHPEQLVALYATRGSEDYPQEFSYPDYQDYVRQSTTFDSIYGYDGTALSVQEMSGEPELIWSESVTGNYFDGLGLRPAVGRLFSPEDDRAPGAHPVAVLSYNYWKKRFAGEAGVVGRKLLINRQPFTVVGVGPRGFIGAGLMNFIPDVWVPSMMRETLAGRDARRYAQRDLQWMDLRGRLKPGVTLQQAEAEMNTVAGRIAREHYRSGKPFLVHLLAAPGRTEPFLVIKGWLTTISTVMGAFVGLLLLIGCANVANLLLARTAAREREIAVRVAVGASRGRIARQLLTESATYALLAGALGLLLGSWLLELMARMFPSLDFAVTDLNQDLRLDARVLAFTTLLSLVTVAFFGLAPAIRASWTAPQSALKGVTQARVTLPRWLSLANVLVALQVALSVVLLVSGGLFWRSLEHATRVGPGFNTKGIAMFSMNVGLHGYSREQGLNFFRQLPARLETLPGVESAALAFPLPLDAYNESSYYFPEGYIPRSADDQPELGHISVGPGYFQTIGTPLVAGRGVEDHDTSDAARMAVINETAARRHWGSADQAVGKRFRLGSNEGPWVQVAGVARDGKYITIGEDPQPFAFFPLTQEYGGRATAIVRHRGNAAEVMTSFRRVVAALDAGLPIYGIRTVNQFLTRSYGGLRMGALLVGLFATAGLALAAIGLFGVLHHSVARRQREIGIRMALGAQHRDVVRLVVVRALLFALAGLAVGLVGSWAMRHLIGALLVGVSPLDPLTYAAITVVLAAAALLACYIPARLASRIDPMVVLRCE